MLRILFPFALTYGRLGLPDRWWHRLAIVLFGASLAVCGAVLAALVFSDVNTYTITDEVASDLGFRFGNGNYDLDVRDRFTYGFNDWLLQNGYVPMIAPDGQSWGMPRQGVTKAINERGYKPEYVQVDVPNIGKVTFTGVSKDEMNKKTAELYRVSRTAIGKAYAKAAFWWFLLLCCLSYALQGVYRVIIYIGFGRQAKATAATQR
jgi:hypothetical protein